MKNTNHQQLFSSFVLSIILLMIIHQGIVTFTINQQQYIGTVINLAGQQQTLAERVARQSETIKYLETQSLASTNERAALQKLIEEWAANQNALINSDPSRNLKKASTSKIKATFDEVTPYFDVIYENAQELVIVKKQEDLLLHVKAIQTNIEPFSVRMGTVIDEIDRHHQSRNFYTKQVSYWAILIVIIILIAQLRFWWMPLIDKMKNHAEEVTLDNNALENKNREVNVEIANIESRNKLLQRQNEILAKSNSELMDLKDEVKELSSVKMEFLSNMSHEIRTPLNAIIGVTNLMIDENPREDQIEHLDTLRFSSDNLMVVINDILDYSRIRAGKIELSPVNFSLVRIFKGIYNTLLPMTNGKSIAFTYYIDANTPELLHGDPIRISQILLNLVNNAIKFTKEGHVRYSVQRLELEEPEIARLLFKVEDTGIGIAKEMQDIIFESFSQVDTRTTREHGGTGLGLAITKQLVELHDSQIQLISAVDEGSTFSFELRLPVVETTPVKATASAQPSAPTTSISKSNRVLLVDDNAINVLIAKRFLNKWQLEVDVANNGQEAVDMVKITPYGLVLMDINMPEMDGYEATRIIRSWDERKFQQLPIVALTASVYDALKYQAIEAGMNDFINKPFKPQELHKIVASYIDVKPFEE